MGQECLLHVIAVGKEVFRQKGSNKEKKRKNVGEVASKKEPRFGRGTPTVQHQEVGKYP
jgi:hypothetical protein